MNKDYCDTTVSIVRQLQEKIMHLCGSEADEKLLEVIVSPCDSKQILTTVIILLRVDSPKKA